MVLCPNCRRPPTTLPRILFRLAWTASCRYCAVDLVPDFRGRMILYLHAFLVCLVVMNFALLSVLRRWEIGVVLLWSAAIVLPLSLTAGVLFWRFGGYEATDSIWTFSRRRIRTWALMVMVVAACASSFLFVSALIHNRTVQGARSSASRAAATFESAWFRDLPGPARRVLERDEQMFAAWIDLLQSGVEDLFAGALLALLPGVFAAFVLLELRAFRPQGGTRR